MKEAEDFVLLSILQGAYNKNIHFKLPPGSPPFEMNENAEEKEITKKAFLFMTKNVMNFSLIQWKREKLFTDFIKSINSDDAKLVVAMKDKDLTTIFPTITRELVKEAFPKYVK